MEEINKKKRDSEILKVYGYISIIASVIGLAIKIIRGDNHLDTWYVLFPIILVIGVLVIRHSNKQINDLSKIYKKQIISKEIEKLIPNSRFIPNNGIDFNLVRNSNLLKIQDEYYSEDLIKGEINGVNFQCADIQMVKLVRTKRNSLGIRTTTFMGRFYEFDFPKSFVSNIFLLQKDQFRQFSGYKKVDLESADFNSEYKILTDNEYDVFYLLTPQLIDKLIILDKKYRDKISLAFTNEKLYIAINSFEDAFDEVDLGEITQEHVNRSIEEIKNVIEFVDYLNLDNKLFKK